MGYPNEESDKLILQAIHEPYSSWLVGLSSFYEFDITEMVELLISDKMDEEASTEAMLKRLERDIQRKAEQDHVRIEKRRREKYLPN